MWTEVVAEVLVCYCWWCMCFNSCSFWHLLWVGQTLALSLHLCPCTVLFSWVSGWRLQVLHPPPPPSHTVKTTGSRYRYLRAYLDVIPFPWDCAKVERDDTCVITFIDIQKQKQVSSQCTKPGGTTQNKKETRELALYQSEWKPFLSSTVFYMVSVLMKYIY